MKPIPPVSSVKDISPNKPPTDGNPTNTDQPNPKTPRSSTELAEPRARPPAPRRRCPARRWRSSWRASGPRAWRLGRHRGGRRGRDGATICFLASGVGRAGGGRGFSCSGFGVVEPESRPGESWRSAFFCFVVPCSKWVDFQLYLYQAGWSTRHNNTHVIVYILFYSQSLWL